MPSLATKSNIDRIEIRGIKLNVLAGTEELDVEVSGGDFFMTREFLEEKGTISQSGVSRL